MNRLTAWLAGAGIGAGLMYIFDPVRGNRRRSLMRDQVVHFQNKSEDLLDKAARDFQNRAKGMVHQVSSKLSSEPASDEVLIDRVRAEMGRVVSHPGAIEVCADQGQVILAGNILANEVDRLLSYVDAIPGVTGIDNRLEVHQEPGDIPDLQGQGKPSAPRFELLQENWTPAARVATAVGGGTLALAALRQGGLLGTLGSMLGLGLMARGLTNMPVKRMVGAGVERRAVEVHKTINVNAPVEEVYKFWTNYDNFPRFMNHLRQVTKTGEGRSHWVFEGPGGVTMEWDAVVTNRVPNQMIAWRSLPGSMVGNVGTIHFTPNQQGGTQVDIQIAYRPPAGALGHTFLSIFGTNLKQVLDEDMVRFKSIIEQGETTAKGEKVIREEIASQ